MTDDENRYSLIVTDDDDAPPPRRLARWLPVGIVSCAMAGFCALALYAYHSSAPAVKEEDLLVVEADKTPIKEKPLDPGGMKFPHQDKTVFDTFAGNAQAPAKPERVLPAPEEPMPPEADTADTQTWVNENLHKKAGAPEQMIGDAKKEVPTAVSPPPDAAATSVTQPADAAPVQVHEAPVATGENKSQDDSKSQPVRISVPPAEDAEAVVPQLAPAKPIAAAVKPAAKPTVVTAKQTGNASAQLGAYRSETDARSDWAKMQKKYSLLAERQPVIMKADLGEKGVYYRLRVTGFADSADVKTFCAKLSAKGQACMLPAGK